MTYDKNLEAYQFLEEKSTEYRQKIIDLYSQLGTEQKSSDAAILGKAQTAAEEQALVKLKEELAVANRSYIEKRNQLQTLTSTSPEQAKSVVQSEVIKDLTSQVAKNKLQYETNLNKYKPQLPRMLALKSEIKSMESRLKKEQKNLYDQLVKTTTKDVQDRRSEVAYLEKEIGLQNQRIVLADLKAKKQSSSIDARIQVLEQNSLVIDKKKEHLEMALGLKQIGRTDTVVVEKGRLPRSPFAPSLKRHLLSGLILAMVLVGLIIFLFEITDRKIHNTEILEMVTALPTLATIPKIEVTLKVKIPKDQKKRKELALKMRQEVGLMTHLKPNAPFSESYRHLRTNIQLSKTTDNKVLLLSSALSGEGKTVSSLNLAASFAQLEKKVLIIDCDLRRPKLHKIFDLPNTKGLVTALVKDGPLQSLITPTQVRNMITYFGFKIGWFYI